jgi:hypothetical protein
MQMLSIDHDLWYHVILAVALPCEKSWERWGQTYLLNIRESLKMLIAGARSYRRKVASCSRRHTLCGLRRGNDSFQHGGGR